MDASFKWDADTFWSNVSASLEARGLLYDYEPHEPNAIVRKQINPCIIPSRYYVW